MFTLSGIVLNTDGNPISEAVVQLIGSQDTLGTIQEAAAITPAAITWTREITGFNSHRWACWDAFVAREVPGITWAEFVNLVVAYNPSLAATGNVFQADRTYLIPESRPVSSEITWEGRPLANFFGNRWDCWLRFIQHKVIGLDWPTFMNEALKHNPELELDQNVFKADKVYKLPRNDSFVAYRTLRTSAEPGRYQFDDLPAGDYRLEVSARGYKTFHQTVRLDSSKQVDLSLATDPAAIQAPADEFVQVQGKGFQLRGQPFKFIGVNIRGLAHYGHDKDYFRFAPFEHRTLQLEAARDMGVRVVRLFLAHKDASPGVVEARLREIVDFVKKRFPEIYLLPALTNLYANVPFSVQGDDKYYADQGGHRTLTRAFYQEGYKENYLPFVKQIVNAFKDEPQIFAWNIGNELKYYLDDIPGHQHDQEIEHFIKFNHTVAAAIRRLDQNHLITTGMISTRHNYMAGKEDLRRRLYGSRNLNFLTIHYPHEGEGGFFNGDDADLAERLDKPFIIEEQGFVGNGRGPQTQADMDRWFAKGASGYMHWGFMATPDNNDGARDIGMDKVFHTDWEELFTLYRKRAAQLAQIA